MKLDKFIQRYRKSRKFGGFGSFRHKAYASAYDPTIEDSTEEAEFACQSFALKSSYGPVKEMEIIKTQV